MRVRRHTTTACGQLRPRDQERTLTFRSQGRLPWLDASRFAAAIIIVAAVLVLPPVFGARARALLEPGLNAMGASLAPDAAFVVSFDDWDAGWFSSTATVSFEAIFRTPPAVAAVSNDLEETYRTTLPGVVTLYHGPVPLGGFGWGSAEFVVDASAIPELHDFHAETGVAEVARLTALVGFLGNTTIGLSVPPISTTEPNGGTQVTSLGWRQP